MRGWSAVLLMLGSLGGAAGAQQEETPAVVSAGPAVGNGDKTVASVSFQLDRPGLAVPHFVLTVREDGTGQYVADEVGVGGAAGAHVDRAIPVSAPTVMKIFAAARAEKYFNVVCASKIKNIADTGKKTLTYAGADGSGSCLYNYSELKDVQMLTDVFQAMALTMDEGRKLEFKKRFDRLGLDAEMGALLHAAQQKQAVEIGTIAPVLTQIVNDGELMQRVRLRATELLGMAKDGQ